MKKIILLLVLTLFSMPLVGQAHTTLSSSSPAEGSVVVESLEEVVLTFGTVVEQGSTMTLESEGTTYEFDEVLLSDEVMTGTITEELPNDTYTINWKIIGVDGHPIEGIVSFELNVEAVVEEPVVEEPATETVEEPAVEKEASVAEEKTAQTVDNSSEDEGSSLVTILLVLAVLVIGFVGYRLMKKK
ncbi:copper resistance protein CopC [Planococcus sp. ANT_H30]|uniref:copper resistance CopC family protein n=1 Tax=Planococcus sp. ANT_H30 TaxID=2597347 RepID=UPI0011EDEB80|nr:copper resistance CopC family protein [Planococcus sp. ANT_H30]KAA0959194.1 copper resistance protein CopC [Planococcus sp. ANT_H30]